MGFITIKKICSHFLTLYAVAHLPLKWFLWNTLTYISTLKGGLNGGTVRHKNCEQTDFTLLGSNVGPMLSVNPEDDQSDIFQGKMTTSDP